MAKKTTCPACKWDSANEWWDKHTKEVMRIKDTDRYVPVDMPKEIHEDEQVQFACPMCGVKVNGTDLIRD